MQSMILCWYSGDDTRMRFSLTPQPGESGFTQWLDAMKMVAKLTGGIPSEFRKRVSFIQGDGPAHFMIIINIDDTGHSIYSSKSPP